jgi:hypothetical protein
MNDHRISEGHPNAEDVAAYVDGIIDGRSRERIEAHAADCEECRREIAEVAQVVQREGRTPSWRLWAPAVAAAAVIGLLMVRPFGTETGPDTTARFRGSGSVEEREGIVAIQVIQPRDGAVLGPTAISFIWHASGTEASYQLTLTDDEGEVVWALTTTDTITALPDTTELANSSSYHWYVDGLLEDGRQANSGVHSFTTAR